MVQVLFSLAYCVILRISHNFGFGQIFTWNLDIIYFGKKILLKGKILAVLFRINIILTDFTLSWILVTSGSFMEWLLPLSPFSSRLPWYFFLMLSWFPFFWRIFLLFSWVFEDSILFDLICFFFFFLPLVVVSSHLSSTYFLFLESSSWTIAPYSLNFYHWTSLFLASSLRVRFFNFIKQ